MKKNEKVKLVIGQTLVISIGTFMAIAAEGLVKHFLGEELNLPWYQIWAVILLGFITALPTVFWLDNEKILPNHPVWKIVIHCLLLHGVITLAGRFLNWYSSIDGYLFLTIGFLAVYGMVWAITIWFLSREEDSINRKLEEIQDED